MKNHPTQLRIMVLNAQDLFLFMDKYDQTPIEQLNEIKWNLMSSSLLNNKTKDKCFALGRMIQSQQVDIVMMSEVGGYESLHNFAQYVLQNEFKAFSLPSNSDRGIDLGYLVRKDLPFDVKLKSHLDFELECREKKFSRDVLRLDLLIEEKPILICLLVHIKSKLDLRRSDFEGRTRRKAEVLGLIKIYQELIPLEVPVVIGGDFNGQAGEKDTEEEFRPIYTQTHLKDVAYLAQIPDSERFSYLYFNRGGQCFKQQIDYLFLDQKYQHLLITDECYFPRYTNKEGLPMPIPQRVEHKQLMPSDHYPFLMTIKLL